MSRNRLLEMQQLLATAATTTSPTSPTSPTGANDQPSPTSPTSPIAATGRPYSPTITTTAAAARTARTATVAPAPSPAALNQRDSPRLHARTVTPNADPHTFTPIGEPAGGDGIPLTVASAVEPPPPPADRGGVPPTYYADDFVILDVGSLDAWLRDVSRLQSQIRSVNRDLDQLERLQGSCMDAVAATDYFTVADEAVPLAHERAMSPNQTRARTRSVGGVSSAAGLLGRSGTLSPEPAPGNSPWSRAERMAADVQVRLGVIRSKVRNLSTLRSNSLSSSDQRLANVHEQMLLHHLMDVTKRFMDLQQAHAQRTREVFQRQLKIAKPDITTSELDWVISSTAAPQVFADSLLIEQERRRAVQSRHHDLLKLESSIEELQQMFSDLALLLEQQETQVDSVAQFVESGVNVLEAGGGQVSDAARLARSSRRKKWWLLLLTLLLGGAIAAVVLGITLSTPTRVVRPPPANAQPMSAEH